MVVEVGSGNTAVNEGRFSSFKTVNGLTKKVKGDVFDDWMRLAGHSFTAGFVIESLRNNDEVYKKLHGDRPVKDVTASDVSKGKGFVSEVLRCIIHFADSTSDSDIYTTILKIPGMESLAAVNENRESIFNVDDDKFVKKFSEFHQSEIDFYEHLAKTLDIPVPRVFKTLPWKIGETEGLIQMEDMTGKGKPLVIGDSLNIPQIKEIVRHLAHMHRMSLTSEDKEFNYWKGKSVRDFEGFESLCKRVNDPREFLQICRDKEYFEPLLNKYKTFAGNAKYMKYAITESWKDLQIPPVIVHGDFHAGNIMWKLDGNGEISNEIYAIYDWQLCHEGSPMADLARIIVLCSDGWIRRQVEGFIFDFYHDQLKKEMKQVRKDCPYTIDQIKKAYNYMFLTQSYGLVLIPKLMDQICMRDASEVRKAKTDAAILKCKHALEDMDKLLSGEMKDMFERFG